MKVDTNTSHKFLMFVNYKELSFWDVKRYLISTIKSKFNFVRLGNLIVEQNQTIRPKDYPERDFEILGVNNKTGIFDAYIQKGREINQLYKIVENGFLAYNPYRINVRSIGLKTLEQKHKYISPAYVVFSCKEELVPEYLFTLFKTDTFNRIIRDNTTGSVRQNLSFDSLCDLKIPFPIPIEQQRLINDYKKHLQQAEQLEQDANNIGQEIETYILAELGIKLRKVVNRQTGKLYTVGYKELSNWVYSASESMFYEDLSKSVFQIIELGSAFEFIYRAWGKKEESQQYIELGGIDPDFGIFETKTIYSKKAPSRATQTVETGDLIVGTTRPYLKKFAIVQGKNNGHVASSAFSVIQENKQNYNLNFLHEILKSAIGIRQFEIKMTGALYPAITFSDLLELKIPFPNIDEQNKIAFRIGKMKDNQKNKYLLAEKLKKQALLEFENALFSIT